MLATGGPSTYLPTLYKAGSIRQRSGQPTVELSIFEYFFYAFAQYPVNAPAAPIPKVTLVDHINVNMSTPSHELIVVIDWCVIVECNPGIFTITFRYIGDS
jgi:hypothetical protein